MPEIQGKSLFEGFLARLGRQHLHHDAILHDFTAMRMDGISHGTSMKEFSVSGWKDSHARFPDFIIPP